MRVADPQAWGPRLEPGNWRWAPLDAPVRLRSNLTNAMPPKRLKDDERSMIGDPQADLAHASADLPDMQEFIFGRAPFDFEVPDMFDRNSDLREVRTPGND